MGDLTGSPISIGDRMKKSSLSGIKNVIWALAIFAALTALLVGFAFSVSTRYNGEKESGVLTLGQGRKADSISDDGVIFSSGADNALNTGVLREMVSTQDNGLSAAFSYTYLCDSSIMGINEYSMDFGSSATAEMWTDDGSGFPAANAANASIIFPSDGSLLTPADAAMVYQPKRLVIYIGGDELAAADEASFISGYTQLINSIRSVSSDTAIICCSIASVSSAYPSSDGLTASLVAQANDWIRQVCSNTGVYYADLASLLNDENGFLRDEYSSPNGRSLGSAGIAEVIQYFRYHGVG